MVNKNYIYFSKRNLLLLYYYLISKAEVLNKMVSELEINVSVLGKEGR